MRKKDLLKEPIKHIDIKSFDSTGIIQAMAGMSFTARDTARAADIFNMMINDKDCTIILCIAGSTGAAGCMQIYADMVKYNMVDVVVATGAAIVDMDFFEALGFSHYKGSTAADDKKLRELYIDRIYDTFINEEQLQICDNTVKEMADSLPGRPHSSREFIKQMGKYLADNAKKEEGYVRHRLTLINTARKSIVKNSVNLCKSVSKDSLVQLACENDVPIFCPAFSDCSAGFGLVKHQAQNPQSHICIDCVKDFRELTEIKMRSAASGLFIIGGGVPKNFAQDTVICAEILGKPVPMHKYAVQITVADVRDGGLSGSTLKEASSWGKVDTGYEQMVYAEATSVLPLIVSYIYHKGDWQSRRKRQWARIFA